MNYSPAHMVYRVIALLTILGALIGLHPVLGMDKPNIIVIYADDLGYGDVACYNPQSKIPTPNLDTLARQGARFTDAHCPATYCVPSRYSLLTGRLQFRSKIPIKIEMGGHCIIEKNRLTLPQMLRDQGYATMMTGKWHLGVTFLDPNASPVRHNGIKGVRMVDFNYPIPDGPTQRGFDRFFGTFECPTNSWLYAYIEDDRVPVPPTREFNEAYKKELGLPVNDYSHDCGPGMIAPNFDFENIDLLFLQKSRQFITEHIKAAPDKPFFLYHASQAVHLPSFPAARFQGKTGTDAHGDFIFELDYIVGEFMKTLEHLGITENTLLLFSSDNGPELPTVRMMRQKHKHNGAHPWRGMKRDNWEGGHRVPLLICWPGKIKAGSVVAQTVNLTDVMATCAAITGATLPNNAAEDSFNILPLLLHGDQKKPIRQYSLQQAYRPHFLSIRRGPWKYLNHKGAGGNDYQRQGVWGAADFVTNTAQDILSIPGQLYHLDRDPGEINNLYLTHPKIVAELKAKLEQFKANGRSAPIR